MGTAAAAGRTVPDGFGGSFFSSKLLEVSEGGGWREGGVGVEGKGGGGGWQGRKWTLKWSSRRLSSSAAAASSSS